MRFDLRLYEVHPFDPRSIRHHLLNKTNHDREKYSRTITVQQTLSICR